MKKQFTFFLIAFFALIVHASMHAQEKCLFIRGQITAAQDGKPLEGVQVVVKTPPTAILSGKNGKYGLTTIRKTGLEISYRSFGYATVVKILTPQLLAQCINDTLVLNIKMEQQSVILPEASILAKSGPDTVIGNWKFFIEDYAFVNDSQLLLLTYEKSLKAARIMLATRQQKIIDAVAVPIEARELYLDYQGHVNVMCKDSAFRIHVFADMHIQLMALPYTDFCERVLPCIDTLGGKILFSNYHKAYPAFSYFTYNPRDTTVFKLRTIVDGPLLAQYNWEFDYLKPKDRLYARKMALETGIDERIIAATITGFPQSQYYTPLYAPMFVVHDTICVFDHCADKLFRYNRNGQAIDSSAIKYHHPKNWKEWSRKMIQDEHTGELYALHDRGGFTYLKKIDLNTGNVIGTFKISSIYAKHIHIRDGVVYYIHRPYESIQTKFLYSERIVLDLED